MNRPLRVPPAVTQALHALAGSSAKQRKALARRRTFRAARYAGGVRMGELPGHTTGVSHLHRLWVDFWGDPDQAWRADKKFRGLSRAAIGIADPRTTAADRERWTPANKAIDIEAQAVIVVLVLEAGKVAIAPDVRAWAVQAWLDAGLPL